MRQRIRSGLAKAVFYYQKHFNDLVINSTLKSNRVGFLFGCCLLLLLVFLVWFFFFPLLLLSGCFRRRPLSLRFRTFLLNCIRSFCSQLSTMLFNLHGDYTLMCITYFISPYLAKLNKPIILPSLRGLFWSLDHPNNSTLCLFQFEFLFLVDQNFT